MRVVRIFVSSPGDALDERRRVGRVIAKLNTAFKDSVQLEALRWEERFYSAHDGFQPQIPRASECDIVLAVLRGRLGSPLSAAFHAALPPEERLPDDGRYPSGTAYEILSAIRARQEKRRGELPDIYVFRWPIPPQVSVDAPDETEVREQWSALKRFAEEVFVTPEGHFKGAYQTYDSLDAFEAQVEALLRDWLDVHVFEGRAVVWPVEIRGSPFRGLEPFGMKHADVFFGRTREIERAAVKLKAAASAGAPFQVVVGPSGAGKSSFLRAGLVPRLTGPGEVEGVGAWRVALVRPGESLDGPVAALAQRLFDGPGAEAEAGRPAALPELSSGAFGTPAALARLFAHADETCAAPILAALASIAKAERDGWGTARDETARLLLVVDQLDEIFATAITDEQRAGFARLLDALGGSGAVWVVASLRAEFYEVFLKSPLAALAGDERTLTLKAPGLAEMAEIVRAPAEAAALTWEADPDTSERLDERLLADIDRPDLLPLLQFVLDRLYEKREGGGGTPLRLTFAAYRGLGTLDGAIRAEAERAFAALGAAEQAALPRLLRVLVTPARAATSEAAESTTYTLSPAPLAAAAPSPAARRLAEALVDARLLVTGQGSDGSATLALAHQRVIEAWDRAKKIVADSAAFHRVREGIAVRGRDWEGAKRPNDLLLPDGVFLKQAEQVAATYGDEIGEADIAYLRASRRRAGRALRRAYTLAALFALVALGAVIAGARAFQEQQRAERNFTLAKTTVDNMIFDVAQGLRSTNGVQIAALKSIFFQINRNVEEIISSNRNDPSLLYLQETMMNEFGKTYLSAGEIDSARDSFQKAFEISKSLLESDPSNIYVQHGKSVTLINLGDIKNHSKDYQAALSLYEEALAIRRKIAVREPNNTKWQAALSGALSSVAEMKQNAGDTHEAIAYYEEDFRINMKLAELEPDNIDIWDSLGIVTERIGWIKFHEDENKDALTALNTSLEIRRRLGTYNPDNSNFQHKISSILTKIGDVEYDNNNFDAALAAFEEAAEINRRLTRIDPSNFIWQRSLSIDAERIGDTRKQKAEYPEALVAYEEDLRIARMLAGRDPIDNDRKRDVLLSLNKIGKLKFLMNDYEGVINTYEVAVSVGQQISKNEPQNLKIRRDVAILLSKIGEMKLKISGSSEALVFYHKALELFRQASNNMPGNLAAQQDLSLSLMKIGDAKLRSADAIGALASYEEGLGIRRIAAKNNPNDTDSQTSLVVSLVKTSELTSDVERKREMLAEAVEIAESLEKAGKLNSDQADWPSDLRERLGKIGR